MRIGIDARMWGPQQTGIGRYIDRLLFHLAHLPHRHDVVAVVLKEQEQALQKAVGGSLDTVAVRDRWYGWGEQLRLPMTLYRADFDLFHVPHFNVPLLYRRPFVVTVHDTTPWEYPGHKMGQSRLRRMAFRATFRSAVARAQQVIAVSEATKNDIRHLVGRTDISVVYEGPGTYDPEDSHSPPDTTDDMVARNALHDRLPDSPFIFAVGVWREHKNFGRLVAAFERLQKSGHETLHLVLGGERETGDPDLVRRVDQSPVRDAIMTPGFLQPQELSAWYRAADVVVVPSLKEGFGFVGLEAMHQATPVVAADAASLPEIYGEAAVYCDPEDIGSIAEAIERVLTDEDRRGSLIERGQQRVQQYSWRRMTEETLRIYEEAIS